MATITVTDRETSEIIENNPYLAGLGFQIDSYSDGVSRYMTWSSNDLTYNFRENERSPDFGFEGQTVGEFSRELKDAFRTAMDDISAVADVSFREVDGRNANADIDYWSVYDEDANYTGYSYAVGGDGVFMNSYYIYGTFPGEPNGLTYGGINYATAIHELLHNMGLSHPHDDNEFSVSFPGVSGPDDTGDHALNQTLYTLLSYNEVRQTLEDGSRSTGWPWSDITSVDRSFATMGAFDIAMLQALYGANTDSAGGDDTYALATANGTGTYYKSIWDTGGIDAISAKTGDAVRIDLRPATLDPEDGALAGGGLSRVEGIYGGFTIAAGVDIENAFTGWGKDDIRGNGLDNKLVSKDGDDVVRGFRGDDIVKLGEGDDRGFGGAGDDTMFGKQGNDTLYGENGHDFIKGNGGADFIKGGKGNDRIVSGGGDDTLSGGGGADEFVFRNDNGDDQLNGFNLKLDLLELKDFAAFEDLDITDTADGALIVLGTGSVLLAGVEAGDLTVDHFIF
ncbi:MAG: hypothetical protein AAGE76_04405 [Pseudomonadota bacterium]